MENNNHYNITIIGAGIVGLAIAHQLSKQFSNILVVDKEKKFGQHVSSRNSEVIHSGFYYPNNSLKAKLCVKGNKMIYEFCENYNIKYNRCGKLVVANNENEINELSKILNVAQGNNVEGIEIIDYLQARKIESKVKCEKALWVPSTGVMDSHAVMSKLENLSIMNNVSIVYNAEVSNIEIKNDIYRLSFKNQSTSLTSNIVINAAGLWSDKINNLLSEEYTLEYYKGDYYKSWKIKEINCLVYPVPTTLSLGVHVLKNINNEIFFGPNIYKVKDINYKIDDTYLKEFQSSIQKILDVKLNDLTPDFSGIRPKLKYKNKFNDFVIESKRDYPNFYNLVGIDSPGLTSSLAIADYVAKMIKNS